MEQPYLTTATGQTYGALSTGKPTPASEYPDLVAVDGESGVVGYALATDIFGDLTRPTSPEDAVRRNSEPRRVPVFASDGRTQLGWFTVG